MHVSFLPPSLLHLLHLLLHFLHFLHLLLHLLHLLHLLFHFLHLLLHLLHLLHFLHLLLHLLLLIPLLPLSLPTAPSDVLPPVLTALSSSSINISFLPPLTPNGIITSYTLTRSTPLTPTPTTIPLNTFSLPMTNGYFVYTDTNLLPFTNYTYVLTICTNGGCTGSSPVQETTLEDTPQGINAPTAIVQNSSTISISWVAPTQPNGVIQSYDLLRRDLGFSNSTAGMMVTNCCEEYLSSQAGSGGIVLSEGCNYITQTPSDITTYTDATLQAYSFYQYCIISSNNADSAHSELSPPTQTDPAPMPAAGPQLNASTVNSTSIYLSWGSLDISELLGPLVGYTLYGRVAGTMGLGEVLLSGLDLSYTATGLVASTEYAFVVSCELLC